MWVFGYGSLIWEPGFTFEEKHIARMEGFRRSFCMRSIHHRGTPEHNGLVLALDQEAGAYCDGLAFRVAADEKDNVLTYLRDRELVSSAYLETVQPVALRSGQRVEAVAYVIDPDHVQYCTLALEEQAQMISTAVGGRGPNSAYLFNTAAHLQELGIDDPELDWLVERVRVLQG